VGPAGVHARCAKDERVVTLTEEFLRLAQSRRSLLTSGLLCGLGLTACRTSEPGHLSGRAGSLPLSQAANLDRGFGAILDRHRVPGIAAGIILDGRLAWAKGYGLADIENRRSMTADMIQNVGSVTKTLTTTLALQDIEAGRLDLDGDINRYLRFPVRNPSHPQVAITLRQLLTHRSSIRDGEAYGNSYRCGDQAVSLEDWLRAYFAPSAKSDHFHAWAPGTVHPPSSPRAYSNVAFGLVGLLSERVGGKAYEALCRERIFGPLGMASSGIRLDTIDRKRESVPYKILAEDFKADDISQVERAFARYPEEKFTPRAGGHFPFCSYSFATPPDGLMRTSVHDLAQFVLAWIGSSTRAQSRGEAPKIVSAETAAMALAPVHYERALGWDFVPRYFGTDDPIPGGTLIGHNGSDPGIGAVVVFRPEDRSGFVMMFNVGMSDAIARDGLKLYLEALSATASARP
jgi:CubicO group peptidase (beta-lactamase class C family)